jgi:glycosyltransferase involved in cell wall biosynthesis
MVNKYYYSFGGAENYMLGLMELLKSRGIESYPFALKHKKNIHSEYENYFIDEIDYNAVHGQLTKLKLGFKSVYSFETRNKLSSYLNNISPDIAHLHNYNYQITTSLLDELKKKKIPVVQTMHDPQVACPHHRLFNYERSELCELCAGNNYYQAVKTKCIKNSYLKSALGSIEAYLNFFRKVYEGKVSVFISPSEFLKKKVTEMTGYKITVEVVPNFYDPRVVNESVQYEDYFLYLGRLSDEKGIRTLLRSMEHVKKGNLYILGAGPLYEEIDNYIKTNKISNINLLGPKNREEVKEYLKYAVFTVVPSELYENCPLSLIESYANAKPVIGTELGGLKEMIIDGETGYKYESKNHLELAEKINILFADKDRTIEMGQNCKRLAETVYNPESHVKKIINIYNNILNK